LLPDVVQRIGQDLHVRKHGGLGGGGWM
jgi:hypothetical protein